MKVLVLPRDTGGDKRKILVLLMDSHCYNLYRRLQKDFTVLVKVFLLVHLPSPIAVKFKRMDFTFQYITCQQNHLHF